MTKDQEQYAAAVIVAAHNRRGDVLELLDSLAADTSVEAGFEVIVADDASQDNTAEAVAFAHPDVHVVRIAGHGGPSRARNLGVAAAKGEVLLFLDSDGAVAPGWKRAMLEAAAPDTVLLGCPVDYETGRVQSVPRRATFLGKSLRCAAERANTGPSCNLGISRALFERIGGFDEEIPYYFEDSDLCIRARKAGAAFKFVPRAVFRHKGSEEKRGDAIRMQEHNSTYVMLKAYRESAWKWVLFSVLNGAWLCLRVLRWAVTGRITDCGRLLGGWVSAYARYFGRDQ